MTMKICKKCKKTPFIQTRLQAHEADVAAGGPGHGNVNDKHHPDAPSIANDIRATCGAPCGCATGWNKPAEHAAVEKAWDEAYG